jgi:hypothetical protein
MSDWNEYTTEELEAICSSDKKTVHGVFFTAEERIWKKTKADSYHQTASLVEIRELSKKCAIKHKAVHSLALTLNDVPSYIILFLSGIIDAATIVTLSVVSLIAVAASLLGLTLITGVYFFVSNYLEQKKLGEKNQRIFDMCIIQKQCTLELIRRHKQAKISHSMFAITEADLLGNLNAEKVPEAQAIDNEDDNEETTFTYTPVIKNKRIKSAISAGGTVAGVLSLTYLLGAPALLAALGATATVAVLLTPLGLGIIVGATIAIGILYGVLHYRKTMNEHKTQKYIDFLTSELENCTDHLKSLRENKKPKKNKETAPEHESSKHALKLTDVPRKLSAFNGSSMMYASNHNQNHSHNNSHHGNSNHSLTTHSTSPSL